MEDKKVVEVKTEEEFKMGKLSQFCVNRDLKRFQRKQVKAQKKAAFEALSDEEKKAFKRKRLLKVGGVAAGVVAGAGAVAYGTMQVLAKQNGGNSEPIGELPEVTETDFEETEYPTEE